MINPEFLFAFVVWLKASEVILICGFSVDLILNRYCFELLNFKEMF